MKTSSNNLQTLVKTIKKMATLTEFSPDYEQLKSFLPQNSMTGPRIFILLIV